MSAFLDALRGARGIGVLAAIVVLALLALVLSNAQLKDAPASTPLEQRRQNLLEGIDGLGRVRVMVVEDEKGCAVSAVIVAPGMTGVRAELEARSAVTTLLGIEAERVAVIGGYN